jgi:G8 domain
LFLSLLSGFLVLIGSSVVKAQQKTSSTARAKRWSDAATWPDKKVPGKDAVVIIERDMDVILDVSPPALHGLTINGKLSFADDKDLELTTEWIMVHGELEIGTEAKPHT